MAKPSLPLEAYFDKLIRHDFPAQLPAWFSKIIARWSWLIIGFVIIVQPWVGWGYWDEVHTAIVDPNFFFYLAFTVSGFEVFLQLLALSDLARLKRRGWELLYCSAFLNILYGVVRIFSSEGSIGPLFGMIVLSAIFFYVLFQIRPEFTHQK